MRKAGLEGGGTRRRTCRMNDLTNAVGTEGVATVGQVDRDVQLVDTHGAPHEKVKLFHRPPCLRVSPFPFPASGLRSSSH